MTYLDRITQFIYPPASGGESEEMRRNRAILVIMALVTSIGGIVWGSLYVLVGIPEVSVWPYGYVVVSFINLQIYLRTRHYQTLLFGQLALILCLPVIMQWHLGGFAASGAVIVWSFLCPTIALIVSEQPKSARRWLYMFIGLMLASGLIEYLFLSSDNDIINLLTIFFFTLNVTVPLLTIYFIIWYFVQSTHKNTETLQVQSAELAQSNKNLQEMTENLEEIVARRTHELADAVKAAESANKSKSLFLANMSHELRTPLNAIIGYSEILEEDAVDFGYEETVPDLQKIRKAGTHLLALINDILDISKIEAGKTDIYLEEFDLSPVLDEIMVTIDPVIKQNNNTLTFEGDMNTLGKITSDVTKLRQMIFNLLSNAAKFTEQGQITLSAHRYTVSSKQDWLHIEVADTGIGMTSAQAEKVFSEFSQADETTTRKYGGTGLGLAISRHFAQMLGGDILVDSKIGEGSTFTIQIPVTAPPPDIADTQSLDDITPSTSSLDPDDNDTVILVIDDDVTIHDVLTRQLTREGFHIITANSGKVGIDMARKYKPTIITLDVMMPEMDGWAVLSQLKADPELSDIPVVMLSILKNKSLGLSLGASDYLTKPVDRDKLLSTINRFIPQDKLENCHVLIIEDDPDTQDVLQRTVERQGWSSQVAENGRVGLDKLRQHIPDIVLLDLMMPEMDGFEFLSTMRQNADWQSIPVIAVTSKTLTESDRKQLSLQAQKVLEKGNYTKDDLLRQIRNVLSAYHPEAET